jgi:hypothetical protein
MATDMIDFASIDSSTDTAAGSAVETQTTDVKTPTEGTETQTTDTPTAPVLNEDGTEQTPEQKETAAAKVESDKAIDTEATPQNVRKALKGLRDASPANANVVKELHGAYERWSAAKTVFPKGVEEMKEAKAFIDAIGGQEGYQKTQEAMDAVKGSDELLYAADPQLSKNVYEDMKAQGKEDAYGKVVGNFLGHLKEVNEKDYYAQIMPHFVNGLQESGLNIKLDQLNAALGEKDAEGKPAPNVRMIQAITKVMTDWYKGMETDEANRKKVPEVTPEHKKFMADKEAFEKEKSTAAAEKTKAFEEGIATECEHFNNTTLGAALKPFLAMPFFKDFPRETMVDLGNGIKDRLYSTLKADKAYQIQMKALWGAKSPDKAKIVAYHQTTLKNIAADIVRNTIQNRYPGYAKGGSAAGKAAAAVVKKETAVKAATQSVATGKPIYVAIRPTNLVREPIKVGGREYSTNDLQTLQITGRGFVKTTDGKSVKFVTWRK